MNRHLKNLTKEAPPRAQAADAPASNPASPRRTWSWRTWTLLLGGLFALYVFGGYFVLKPEYQWATINGILDGMMKAASTAESTAAEADKAGKVATQTEDAKVKPAIEIASAAAAIEVEKAQKLADVEVGKQARLNALAAAQAPAVTSAAAYQQCLERAQQSSETAAAAYSDSSGHTTFGGRDGARLLVLSQALESCERLKPLDEQAREAAKDALAPNP